MRDPALYAKLYPDRRWGEIYDNVSYREVASPYPLAAHAIFRLAHWLRPGSLLALKLIVLGASETSRCWPTPGIR